MGCLPGGLVFGDGYDDGVEFFAWIRLSTRRRGAGGPRTGSHETVTLRKVRADYHMRFTSLFYRFFYRFRQRFD